MRRVNMHEAKTHLSRLVDEAAAGGKAGPSPLPRRLELLEGQCSVPDDFDRCGSEAIADLFEEV